MLRKLNFDAVGIIKHRILLLKSFKELTLIVRSGNLRECEYSYVLVYRAGPFFSFLSQNCFAWTRSKQRR